MVDPGTVIAVVGAVANLINQSHVKSWESDVSDKLDLIIENTSQILTELRDLKVELRNIIEESRLKEIAVKISILPGTIADIAKGYPEIGSVKQIEDKTIELQLQKIYIDSGDLARQGMTFGSSAYAAVALGVSTNILVGRWLRIREATIRSIYGDVVRYLSGCVDFNKSNSLAWAANDWNNSKNLKISEGSGFVRKGGLGHWYLSGGGPPGHGHEVNRDPEARYFSRPVLLFERIPAFAWCEISGGVEAGFSHGAISVDRNQLYPNFPETRGITYGSEFNLEQRIAMVLAAANQIQKEYAGLNEKYVAINNHLIACRLAITILENMAATTLPADYPE